MPGRQVPTAIRWRPIVGLVVLIGLLVILNIVARDAFDALNFRIRPGNEDAMHRTIMVSAVLYALLLAIPFVPSVEIGLGLMVMLGPRIALLVYLCTLAGLAISFTAGRLIPIAGLVHLAHDLRLRRIAGLLQAIEPMNDRQRLNLLIDKPRGRFLPLLLRYRYLALAVALNLPGNQMIGGGGGISLFAGISRLYSVAGFIATIAVAVAPLPLGVMVFGTGFLSG